MDQTEATKNYETIRCCDVTETSFLFNEIFLSKEDLVKRPFLF